jgi:hypothetical protein
MRDMKVRRQTKKVLLKMRFLMKVAIMKGIILWIRAGLGCTV